jgi:PPM family protein phosphatase
MDAVTEAPQGPELGTTKEIGLKFSGKSIPSIGHPERNEDSLAFSPSGGFAMVLDGVGGLQNGDKASLTARDQIARKLKEIPQNADPETAKRSVSNALKEASTVVAAKVPEGQTTATVVKFTESGGVKRAIVGHVGDSRAYILREGKLIQITEDDSILSATGLSLPEKKTLGQKLDDIETQQDLAKLTPQERSYFDNRNLIDSALGDPQTPNPHIYHVALQEGDRILLTSDGIHDNLSRREIDQIIRSNVANLPSVLTEKAVQRSREKGIHVRAKPDDISALVVEVGETEQTLQKTAEQAQKSGQIAKELSPQEDLEQAQLMLQVAMAKKAVRNMRWDGQKVQVAKIIGERLSKGETIDEIITKSAANLRAARGRMGLK